MPFDDRIVGIGLDREGWIEVLWNTHFRARFSPDGQQSTLGGLRALIEHEMAQDEERSFMINRSSFTERREEELLAQLEDLFADLLD